MKFGDLLKKIRNEKGDSLRVLGEKMDIAFTYIDKIEKGISPVSKNFFEKIVTVYPDYQEEFTEAYLSEVLPTKILEKAKFKTLSIKKTLTKHNFKLYSSNSEEEGILSKKYEYKELIIPMGLEFNEKDFCVRIIGNEFVEFLNNDILLVEKMNLPIQRLNKKIIIYKNKNELHMRRIVIVDYIAYLYSLNEAYEPIKYEESLKVIGLVSKLLYRDLLK